ncbi:MAG: hypothetical protein M3448_05015 [Pseudomonadota bacterium]|nr:hypothetical protein [Pseudomonadota bacterium]
MGPELFDTLGAIVASTRSIAALERSNLLEAVYSSDLLATDSEPASSRPAARGRWFAGVLQRLAGCSLVFADPDKGLIDDDPQRRTRLRFGKQMPLSEAKAISVGRTTIIYHHNTRRAGGHEQEIRHWQELLGGGAIAVRANACSCRTFFIVNPTPTIVKRAQAFCDQWAPHKVSFVEALT